MPEQHYDAELSFRHAKNWDAQMTVQPDSALDEELVAF
jgi:hypothetical protein